MHYCADRGLNPVFLTQNITLLSLVYLDFLNSSFQFGECIECGLG